MIFHRSGCIVLNAVGKFYHFKGNNVGSGAPRSRVGQISHSVVLGTINVGDQGGEGISQDITRVRYCIFCFYLEYMLSIKFFYFLSFTCVSDDVLLWYCLKTLFIDVI